MQHAAEVMASPGLQRAAANLGWLFAERAVRLVLGVGVGFLVARHLGPEQLGGLNYAIALTTLAGAVVSLGVESIVKRDVLREPARTAEILASGACLRLLAALPAIGALLGFAALAPGAEAPLLALLAATLLQPALLLPEVWLQSQLLARPATVIQTAVLGVGAALRLWLIATAAPLAGFAAVLVLEAGLAAAGLHWAARRAGCPFRWSAATRSEMGRLLRESWPLLFASLAVVLYMKIDEVMLRHLVGPAAVGLYSAATRLTEIWYFIPTALASSTLPALLRARERGSEAYHLRLQQYFDLSAAAAYALAVPVALAAPWIVRLAYGPEYSASAGIVALHVWASVFVFLGVARGQWLVNESHQRFYLVATSGGALLNIGLNLLLIPRWGGLGAALATVISYAAAAWLSSFLHRSVRPIALLQTRALLIPFRAWGYLRRS